LTALSVCDYVSCEQESRHLHLVKVGEPHIFRPVLIYCKVDGTKRPSTYFLLYDILVDAVHSRSVVVTAAVVRAGIQGFLTVR
jgi:hypothetical protein